MNGSIRTLIIATFTLASSLHAGTPAHPSTSSAAIRPCSIKKGSSMNELNQAQLQWLVDRAQISDLLYSFASCLDAKDYQGYANNFVDGGYVEIPEPTSTKGETFKMFKEKMPELMPHGLSKYTGTHHISSNHQIKVDGDTASSRSYLQATHIGATPFEHWAGGGWYDCTFRRTPQGWKFATARLNVLWISGNPKQMKAE